MGNKSSKRNNKRNTLSLPKKYGKNKLKVASPPVVPLRDTKNRGPDEPKSLNKDDGGPPKLSPRIPDNNRSPEVQKRSPKGAKDSSPESSPKIRIAASLEIIPSSPVVRSSSPKSDDEDDERKRQLQARHGKRTVTFSDDPIAPDAPTSGKGNKAMLPDPDAKPTKGLLKSSSSFLDLNAQPPEKDLDPPDSPNTTKSDTERTPKKGFDTQKLKVTRSDPAITSNESSAPPKTKTWAEMMAYRQQKEIQEALMERNKSGRKGPGRNGQQETGVIDDPAVSSLIAEIEALASSSSTGISSVTFGALIASSRNSVSDITSLLRVAKERNLIKYEGNFLLEGQNNGVSIFLMSNKIRP